MRKNYKWVVVAIASLGLFSPNYTQYQLSPLAPQLMQSLHLSMSQFSSIFTAPMIPAIFLGLISGLLVDKYGLKIVISIGLIAAAAGTCLRIFANDYITMYVYMIMVGLGATFLNPNSAKIVGCFFPPEKVSARVSILLGVAPLAMTIALATTALFPTMKSAYVVAAVISVVAAALWLALMKDPQKIQQQTCVTIQSVSMKESLKAVMKSRAVWIVGLCLFWILACNVAVSSFLPTALIGRGIDSVAAGVYSSVMTVGFLVGCFATPFVANKIGKTKPVLLVLALITAIGAALAWKMPAGFLLGAGLFVTGAAIAGMMPLFFSIPIQLSEIGPKYAGTAGGFASTLELLGAVLIPPYIITPIANSNMTIYFVLSGVCMIIVAALVLLLPEVMPKREKAKAVR